MEAKAEKYISIPESEYLAYQQLASELALLKEQFSQLQRMIFGVKSERFIPSDTDQLALFDTNQEVEKEIETEEITYQRNKTKKEDKQKPIRAHLPAHLPREVETIEPEGIDENAQKIGEEVTELLEYNPGKVYVRQIVRPKYLTVKKESDTDQEDKIIKVAKLPSLPIPKGNAGASLLAHIQVSKWVDHLPYYRQVQIFKRAGVQLSESTINGWFTATCNLLNPLYELLVKEIQSQSYLQADESSIKVQDGHTKKATHTGYYWVYHAPLVKLVAFNYRPSRSREGPVIFLKDFQGILQTDGYTAYNQLGKSKGITLLACMAHARRYFEKALDNDRKRAEYALKAIQSLYVIEREAKELTREEREQLRETQAMPILNDWKEWLIDEQGKVAPKSSIGKAISYTLNLWSRLVSYTQDGHYLIDNNRIENTIRPLALGRKNYLFAGSHNAAQRAAMMYSFFATCKLNDIEPYQWLKYVLDNIQEWRMTELHKLLPNNWIPEINA